ncbi:MAG: 2-oxoacid:acceptor oxidoreductase family protein, partial [Synergistaceae bacterium]|nr:2-oxoacid:acceptor oxidoreductase family protein [Synergistaceae bacterium]
EVKCHVVRRELPDVRMQNVALLGKIAAEKLIPGLEREHYDKALSDVLAPGVLQANLAIFR